LLYVGHMFVQILVKMKNENSMSKLTNSVITNATAEWEFFGRQEIDSNGDYVKKGKEETDDGFWQRVGEYWAYGINNTNLDGRDTDQPWSAAFISYIMRKSGLGKNFSYSDAHRNYINEAIKDKKNNDRTAYFWGYKISDYKPKIGDLVCYSRSTGVNYDNLPNGYKSHADIVVDIIGNELIVIGGNVQQSVSKKHVKINAEGKIIDTQKDWFAVLENRFSEFEVRRTTYSEAWLKKALEITGDFETSGYPFAAVTGDFDGMGISCGVLQWNIGKKSLQPLIIKASESLVNKFMPLYGEQLWDAANTSVAEGLSIVRKWQKGNKLDIICKNELSAFFGSNEMVAIQLEAAKDNHKDALKNTTDWANYFNDDLNLKAYCWFFDLDVLNGSLKDVTFKQCKDFVEANGLSKTKQIVFDFIEKYPSVVDENGQKINTYGRNDALKNIAVWKNRINEGNLHLCVLSYLRAQKSRPQFQLVTLNRKATIAVGIGYVNAELEEFEF
jgi:hypothetical protein